jgi:hypothetical protein
MKPKLFFKKLRLYLAVKEDCDAHHNLGLIGIGAGHGESGVLDAKQDLCDRIERQGGNLVGTLGFVHSSNGRTRSGSGSGYLGWKNFGSQKAVLSYLEQYFTIIDCDEVFEPDPEVKSQAKRQKTLPHAGSKLANANSMRDQTKILAEIGFEDVAQWEIENDHKIRDYGDDSEVWEELKEPKNALYAFCVGTEVLYIGKTSRSLEKRFVGYRDPGKTRATNWKCHKEIRKYLNDNKTVRIMVLADRTHFHWGQFRVSLAAGLEDSLVEILRPQLNGKNGKIFKTESEQLEEEGPTGSYPP